MDWFVVVLVLALVVVGFSIYIVPQQSIAIIERFGKFHRTSDAGIHLRIPLIDVIKAKSSLRVQQLDQTISTKTKDNVFVEAKTSVQFRVDPANVQVAFYELAHPEQQIRAYVEDALRASVPALSLDDAFEKKDDIARSVQETISEEMSRFGFHIIKTLITELEPDIKVKNSMNEINAAQRQRVAAQELANADKIKVVTRAEAEAEEARLRGEGVAAQRKAIVNGLSESFTELSKSGLNESQIMSVLLTNQYLDSLNRFADYGNSTVFLPASPDGIEDIRTQILTALAAKGNKKD